MAMAGQLAPVSFSDRPREPLKTVRTPSLSCSMSRTRLKEIAPQKVALARPLSAQFEGLAKARDSLLRFP